MDEVVKDIGKQPGAKQSGTAYLIVQYYQPIQDGFGGRPPLVSSLEKDCLHTTREHFNGHDSCLAPVPDLLEETLNYSKGKDSATVCVRRGQCAKGFKRDALPSLEQDAKKVRIGQSL